MRLASLVTWSVTVLLLLAARGSSTIQTPERGSASRVDILENAYGLRVLEDKDLYLQAVAEAASKQLVELQKEVFGIRGLRYPPRHPLRYGEQLLWASSSTRSPPRRWAHTCRRVAYRGARRTRRPGSRDKGLRRLPSVRGYGEDVGPCQDPDYVADPGEGLRHDRGCVVDLTLIDGNGEELLMLQTSRTPARGPDTTMRTCPKAPHATATSCAR
jgi:hypothetical protein